jgi:predicted AlkP superfamily phosphohydrolase/phosphomutase
MDKKVFVFAIDSIDPDLLLGLAQSGRMPALKSSVWAYTDNTPSIGESIWLNFITAVNPARHGRYFHSQIVPGSYRTRLFRPTDVKAPSYWSRLSEAGKRVVVVDVPKTCVSGPLNGIQIVDWATHDQEISAGLSTWPPGLASQLDRRFGADPIRANDFGGNGPRDIGAYRDSTVANVARKTKLATSLMKEADWDHFLLVYDDGHHVGHYTWHVHDPDHPDHDPVLRERIGSPLEDVCLALDTALQTILENLEPDCVFTLFVSHGIGPNYHATYILDAILRRLEGVRPGRGRPVNSLRALWRAMPVSLNWLLTPVQNAARNALLEPDRRRRKAFLLPATDDAGLIRINLAGREPRGLIQPGADYARFCDSLEEDLLALRNAETGGAVVDRVTRVAELCCGPCLDQLPDLSVSWNRADPIRVVQSAAIGTVRMPERNSRKGIHTQQGLFLVRTTSGNEGRLPQPVRVMDIAPTICSWTGVDLDNVDGSVFAGLRPG